MIYLDTSYIFKCYINEPGTSEVLALVHRASGCGSAQHGRIEFWSGMHRRVGEKKTSIEQARSIWRQFEQDERDGIWHWFAPTERVVKRAGEAFEKLPPNVFLRSGDAFHLASAAENGFLDVHSGDRILLAAAPHFGLNGVSVY
jgi:predicted nucleic acid-binding protein